MVIKKGCCPMNLNHKTLQRYDNYLEYANNSVFFAISCIFLCFRGVFVHNCIIIPCFAIKYLYFCSKESMRILGLIEYANAHAQKRPSR